jgi:hypothetical protein
MLHGLPMNTSNQTLQAATSTGKYQIFPLLTKETAFGAFT